MIINFDGLLISPVLTFIYLIEVAVHTTSSTLNTATEIPKAEFNNLLKCVYGWIPKAVQTILGHDCSSHCAVY